MNADCNSYKQALMTIRTRKFELDYSDVKSA